MKRTLSRRDCLGRLCIGTAVLGAGAASSGCAGARRSDFLDQGRGWETVTTLGDSRYTEALYYASLAPSSHNSQPWQIVVESKNVWRIEVPAERRLTVVDPTGREALVSVGAFLEYFQMAAESLGISSEVQTDPAATGDGFVARVTLGEPGSGTGASLAAIAARRTLRSNYASKEISASDVTALATAWNGEFLFFSPGSTQADYLRDGAAESFRQQTANDAAQRELMNWTRLKTEDARKYRDGLTTESMEINGIAGWFVRTFMTQEDIMGESFRSQGMDKTIQQVKKCGGWAVAAVADPSPAGAIQAGRNYARMCLLLRDRKLAAHPMTQVLEETPWREEIRSSLGISGTPHFVVRLGYFEDYPDPVSLRRPPAWFVSA